MNTDSTLKKIFEQCGDGLLITDTDNTIVHANNAAEQISGYAAQELIGKKPNLFKSGRQNSTFYQNMWRSITTTGTWHGEIWNRRKDETVYPAWLSISTIRDRNGKIINYFSIFNEITETFHLGEQAQRLRYYDALTDLPNRFLFQDRLHHALLRAGRNNEYVVVMFMDIDNFKLINESMGHEIGDTLLVQYTDRLSTCIRKGETFARMGGDEFAVILADIADSSFAARGATAAAQRIIKALSRPIVIGNNKFFITTSIGITIYPDDARDSSDLINDAEAAMYHAKKTAIGSYRFYAAHMNARVKERLNIINKLHTALDNNEFSLCFQPQINVVSNTVVGVESLLRWNNAELGSVSPAQFIPLLEESRLILPVGRWVLETALATYKEWQDAGIAPGRVSVNISARQFDEPQLAEIVGKVLSAIGLGAHCLDLEITESMIMTNSDRAVSMLHKLKDIEVQISIDDFGTGYSSMSYLKRFPLNRLKIDRSFIQDIPKDADDIAITSAIIAIAHNLNLQVVAEGVETVEQLEFLRAHNCEEIQGFLFSKPLPADKCTAYLKEHRTK